MHFGWANGLLLSAALTLAACGQGGADPADGQKREAAFFLKSNSRAEGVQTLPSGLQYKVVKSGPPGGASPDGNDLVRVDYEGALVDGTVFDSSYDRGAPAIFTPETVIPGWAEGIQHMHVGDEWLLYVPPELGYGETGSGDVPPNAVLVFRVQLLDVARAEGGGAPSMG